MVISAFYVIGARTLYNNVGYSGLELKSTNIIRQIDFLSLILRESKWQKGKFLPHGFKDQH